MENGGQNNSKHTPLHYDGPIVLAILDGVGLSAKREHNAIKQAHTEFLDNVASNYPVVALRASGEAVGLPPHTMGNSEVGHNAIGSGQIIKQGVARIDEAFNTGEIWRSKTWTDLIAHVLENDSTLHFSGIFSDGGVHSDIKHLKAMIQRAHNQGVKKIRLHAVLDGRDTPPQSAEKYIKELLDFMAEFPDAVDYQFASGGGRMVYVADRYENDWGVVKAGWDAMVHGVAPHHFSNITEAIETFRQQDSEIQDQYLPAFIIEKDGRPVGQVKDSDGFIYFDFRADRAIEIAMAMTYYDFLYFDRGHRPENVYFAGLTEYNSDTHVPEHQLVPPIKIEHPLNTYLSSKNITQLSVAETVKFGHITYYFNGNSYDKAPGEEQIEIPSDTMPFDTRPWMKSAETTDAVLENLENYHFLRINFPGGDMVGHFAELEPTIAAIEAIDIGLNRIAKAVDKLGGALIITADHGNAEELADENGVKKTAHTENPVPFMIYDNTKNRDKYHFKSLPNAGLANIAATIANLMGETDYPSSWQESLIIVK